MSNRSDKETLDSFFESSNARFEEDISNEADMLNIVVIGRVSSGKSSLVNALLGNVRKNSVFKVRAESGVTSLVRCLRLNDLVRIIDSPGLDDVRAKHSSITQNFFTKVDIGILVVDGSSDARQKQHLDDLRSQCANIFVVFNKIDEFDKWQPAVLKRVVNQWKQDLGISDIYPTCTFGYDPELHEDMKLDIRGIDRLRKDIEGLLRQKWEEILKTRAFYQKRAAVIEIVANAMLTMTEQAFTLKSSPYMLGTLTMAFAEIQHVFLEQISSGPETMETMTLFTSGNPCAMGFLWPGSPNPPTFVLDVPTAQEAIASGLTILMTLVEMQRRKKELTKENVDSELRPYHYVIKEKLTDTSPENWREKSFWHGLVSSLLSYQGVSSTQSLQ